MIDIKFSIIFVLISFLFLSILFYIPNILIKNHIIKDQNTKNIDKNYSYFVINEPIISDELIYAKSIARMLNGEFKNNKFQIYEHKNEFNPSYFFIPIFIGFIFSKLIGSLDFFFEIKNLIFVFLNLSFLYYFLRTNKINKFVSFLGSILIITGFNLNLMYNIVTFNYTFEEINNGNYISFIIERFPSQIIILYTFIFYYLVSLYLNKDTKNITIVLGIYAGLSYYFYFYSYLFFGTQLIILYIFSSIKKKKVFNNSIFSPLIYLIVGMPYIFNLFKYINSNNYIFHKAITGFTKFDFAFVSKSLLEVTIIVIFSIITLFFICKKEKRYFNLAYICLSVGIPAYLFGVISTKFNIIPEVQHIFGNYEWPFFLNLLIIILIDFVIKKNINFSRILKLNNILYIFLSYYLISYFFFVLMFQIETSKNNYYKNLISNSKVEAYEWLKKNTNKNDVVLTLDSESIRLIPILAGNYVYLPYALDDIENHQRTLKRLHKSLEYYGIDRINFFDFLNNKYFQSDDNLNINNELILNLFGSTFNFRKYESRKLFQNEISKKEKKLFENKNIFIPKKIYFKENISSENFKLDYILITKFERELIPDFIGLINLYDMVYSNKEVAILKVDQN